MMENFDWNDLQYFVSLVNHHTLTATADAMDVQHTTVARRIEKLEQALNVKLFDRMGKRYHLTHEGELLFTQASNIQSQIHTLGRMAMNQNALQGEVVVSAPPVLANEVLMPYLAEFHQQYPHIRLSLQGEVNRSNLHHKEADIALRIGRPTEASLVIRKLRDITYQLYAHSNYLDKLTKRLTNSNETTLVDCPIDIIEFTGSKRIQAWTDALKTRHPVQISFATNDLYICKHAIKQQMGMGILPNLLQLEEELVTIEQYCHDQQKTLGDGLHDEFVVDLCDKKTSELYLVMHEDVRLAPRIRAVADWLVGLLKG